MATKKEMVQRAKAWKPVRTAKGGYCSPACGRGCTEAEFKAAMDNAARLADKLGSGWMMDVFENLGWNYGVFKGKPMGHSRGLIEVKEYHAAYGKPYYTVFIQSSPQFVVKGNNVKKAIAKGLKMLDDHIEMMEKCRATLGDQK